MELKKIQQIEQATWVNFEEIHRLGMTFLFILGIILYVGSLGLVSVMLVVAGIIAAMLFFTIRGMTLP